MHAIRTKISQTGSNIGDVVRKPDFVEETNKAADQPRGCAGLSATLIFPILRVQ